MANTDTWAFFALVVFFLSLGTLLPFINAAFSQGVTEQDLNGLPDSDESLNVVSMLEVLVSVFTVFFWTFGQVYFLIDLLLLMPLRILGIYLFARMVRGN